MKSIRKHYLDYKYVVAVTTAIFMFFLSVNSAFGFGPYLQIYVIASFLMIGATFIGYATGAHRLTPTYTYDILVYVFFLYICILTVFVHNSKTLVYLLVYAYVFIFLYRSFEHAMHACGVEKILFYNYIGVVFTTIFVLCDAVFFTIFEWDVNNFIPRIGPPPPLIGDVAHRRAYGLSNEPTNLSAYLLPMGTLAIYYAKKELKHYTFLMVTLGICLALILTLAGSAFASLVVASSIVLVFSICLSLYCSKINMVLLKFIGVVLLLAIAIYLLRSTSYVNEVLQKVMFADKHFGSGRGDMWINTINLSLENHILPYGLGFASENEIPIVNWYLMLLLELGPISNILIGLFIISICCVILTSALPYTEKFLFSIILLASFIQLNGFSTFYYPFAFIYALIMAELSRQYKAAS